MPRRPGCYDGRPAWNDWDDARVEHASTSTPWDPGRAVYGTLAVGALLAAESTRRETYGQTVGAVVLTLVLYLLAHSYSELTGRRLRQQAHLTVRELALEMRDEVPMVAAGAVPLVPILAFWAAGGALDHALLAGVWTVVAVLIAVEALAAWRLRLSGAELARQAALGAGLGLLVIALRAILH